MHTIDSDVIYIHDWRGIGIALRSRQPLFELYGVQSTIDMHVNFT